VKGLPVVHHPAFTAVLPTDHRFPMAKFAALAERLIADEIIAPGGFAEPAAPVPREWIELVHDRAYIDQVLTGTVPPAIEREIGLPVSETIVRRALYACAGTVLSGRLALGHGIACSTAGGGHHARPERGAGFCVFNDVAIAIRVLQSESLIERALVIDLDVHQGDGTAAVFRDDPNVITFSMHSERNYPLRKIASDLDIGLPDRTGDDAYLDALGEALPRLLENMRPDIVFYNAGVDPHRDDRLGRLALSEEGIAMRDLHVIDAVRSRSIPLAGIIGGGYADDVATLARLHASLHHTAAMFVG
jgi:acetoin utilization deacetylase AcuC-like enzyme